MNIHYNILIVEDNELDREKIKRSFKRLGINSPVFSATDGAEALDLLRGKKASKGFSKPFVILLDMNMPKMNGIEFLQEIRQDPEHKSTPVIIFTTSDRQQDIQNAYQYNIAGYIVKPLRREETLDALEKFSAYWQISKHPC